MLKPFGSTVFACALALGCDAPPRAQVVVHVDTDMPLVSDLDEGTSGDAAIDSLRVELLDRDLNVIDSRMLNLYRAAELPLSFGVPSDVTEDGRLLLRLRGFRAMFSTPGELSLLPTLDPRPEVTVDRLVSLSLPGDGVEDVVITLRGECIGSPIHFALDGNDRSCIDGENLDAIASDGVTHDVPTVSLAGSWTRAKVKACRGEAPSHSRCIPGGVMVLGDPLFLSIVDYQYEAVPLRVVEASPFFLDETEVTVGMLRELVAAGYGGPTPLDKSANGACTWHASSPDDLPLNCVTYAVADAICDARGGRVPSEVEWEYAARGRGNRWLYPWGNDPPQCCSASVARIPNSDCEQGGLEPVASHLSTSACRGDISRDGIVDLAGSLSELMRDSVSHSFAESCWEPPDGGPRILVDQVCDGASSTRMSRGAAWTFPFGDVPLPIRRGYLQNTPDRGFRCAFAQAT